MNYINEMYRNIEADFILPIYADKKKLSRSKILENSIRTIFFVDKDRRTREFGVKLEKNYSIEIINSLPKWNGIEICVERMHDYEQDTYDCIVFQQLDDYEKYIFEIIVDDIYNALNCLSNTEKITATIMGILIKWKKFFLIQQEIKMSEIKQQGLYGELVLLEKLTEKYGGQAVYWWTGCNMETHDFYVDSNAIEVKTTCAKGPYKINISSEFQLDSLDVNGTLFLQFYVLRKSETDGERLPEIIIRIKDMLMGQQNCIDELSSKLFKYGYIERHPELYNIGFKQREIYNYEIREKFPKITCRDLPAGIGGITYTLSLSSCEQFHINEDYMYMRLKRCSNDN